MLVFLITLGGALTRKLNSPNGQCNVRKSLNLMNTISCGVAWKTKKNTFFKKQSGEVTDNTGSDLKNKPEQTGKQSGEVVENTFLWKKQTQKQTGPCC
jgi:hypothetical protein